MKKIYEKPALSKRGMLGALAAAPTSMGSPPPP
jgi:hypothetical protein